MYVSFILSIVCYTGVFVYCLQCEDVFYPVIHGNVDIVDILVRIGYIIIVLDEERIESANRIVQGLILIYKE